LEIPLRSSFFENKTQRVTLRCRDSRVRSLHLILCAYLLFPSPLLGSPIDLGKGRVSCQCKRHSTLVRMQTSL